MLLYVRQLIHLWLRMLRSPEKVALIVLATLLGLLTGACIWLFREGIEVFHRLFAEFLAEEALPPLLGSASVVASLALAGFIVGSIMDRFIGEERHHGVAGVIEAVALAGGRLRYRRMPYKAVASALSLGAGASVGPEDPSVQIGANLGSFLGHGLHLSEERTRLLVAAGAASAISAAFKAPIAGVFFALEVVLNSSYEAASVGMIVLSAVFASAFMVAIEPGAEMGPFNFTLGSPVEIILFVPLGAALALVSIAFIRAMTWQQTLWHDHIHLPRPLRTALAGALVGVVALFVPQIMGPGREVMSSILSGEANYPLVLLLVLGGAKLMMTAVSAAGGFVGGIFAPTLFVGIMFGSAYGDLIARLIPGEISDPQAYAIGGMAGVMAGVVRSPITAIMLVFELTNDYRLILPIMLTTVTCVLFAERWEPLGLYVLGLQRKGIRLPEGREVDLMQAVSVREAMAVPAPTISETASLTALRDTLRQTRSLAVCVLDDKQELAGIVTLSDLQNAYEQAQAANIARTVGDICTRSVITAGPDEMLWSAIRTMSAYDIGRLPVLAPGTRTVIGILGRHGVMRAYNIATTRRLQDQHTAERIRLNMLTGAHVFEVYLLAESPLPGRQIKDVRWPAESVVASIMRRGKLIVPQGSTELHVGDLLTIVADPAAEHELALITGQQPVDSA